MNYYVNLINETITYIEDNIHEKLSLDDLASHFCISKFHFNRMFKTVSGMTLKQYILGRKLTQSLSYLKEKGVAVTDIAYEFGFEYPEVFSRAFKKQFGVSPSACKVEKTNENLVKKASIVERDIVNYKGTLTLNGTYVYLDKLHLEGIFVEVDIHNEQFKALMTSTGQTFLEASQKSDWLDHERLYTVVNCHGEDTGEYTVFYGKSELVAKETSFKKYTIPSGWYTKFIYYGDMFDIREAFVDDLYKWIMAKEIKLNPNGVGMLNIFEKDYLKTSEVQILVPIKSPYKQQEMS
ncbi:AraC family transcriptional regulator [Anaerovirgula multivorans]|uniref:AraC family transcriptional regulator n=1 Tax=Anaerovirgula multivorans TaxID=312168 RepID=A0A239KNW8_9FIRM|nr:AraC family transcriptional regulator [Anaerovirgula multivorans]SNT19422.1 AraC family transcriptional regulator [Anaerovirgula multivorans]